MLQHNDEFQWHQSFKRFKNTLNIGVAKGLKATVRSLTYSTQLFNSKCYNLIVCSSCTSLSTLIKTICLTTGFQFLWYGFCPIYISQRPLSTPDCVGPVWVPVASNSCKKKEKKKKKICILMSNLIQDEHYSFFLDIAQFHHSSGKRKI